MPPNTKRACEVLLFVRPYRRPVHINVRVWHWGEAPFLPRGLALWSSKHERMHARHTTFMYTLHMHARTDCTHPFCNTRCAHAHAHACIHALYAMRRQSHMHARKRTRLQESIVYCIVYCTHTFRQAPVHSYAGYGQASTYACTHALHVCTHYTRACTHCASTYTGTHVCMRACTGHMHASTRV